MKTTHTCLLVQSCKATVLFSASAQLEAITILQQAAKILVICLSGQSGRSLKHYIFASRCQNTNERIWNQFPLGQDGRSSSLGNDRRHGGPTTIQLHQMRYVHGIQEEENCLIRTYWFDVTLFSASAVPKAQGNSQEQQRGVHGHSCRSGGSGPALSSMQRPLFYHGLCGSTWMS